MRKLLAVLALHLAALAGPFLPACQSQASYTGTGPGSYISLGATFSGFESGQYGQSKLGGGALYLDANLYRKIGVEVEARELDLHTNPASRLEGIRETNYLVGPKISARGRGLRPYAKILAGRGDFRFPYGYAYGKYFMIAPGAGLDWRIHHSKVTIRVIDFEYQIWPNFVPYGQIYPYGASAGFSYQLF